MPIQSTSATLPAGLPVNTQSLRQGAELAQSLQWKQNQLLTAQVVKLAAGETALRINGQLYTPVSPLPLTPGITKQLRVVSLDPVIKLTLVDSGAAKDMPLRLLGPTITPMNNSLWAATVSSGPYQLATLLAVFNKPPQVMQQHLPAQIQASLTAIAALLPNTDDLRSAARLRQALTTVSLNGSSTSGRIASGSAGELGSLIQTLHQQLSRSVQENRSQAPGQQLVDPYRGESAMRTSVATTLLTILDDVLGMQGNRTHRQGSQPYLPLMHWSWEFPLVGKKRAQLFSLNAWLRQRKQDKSGKIREIWCLRCACALPEHGELAIVLRLKNREVRIFLLCEHESSKQRLDKLEKTLTQELDQFGLHLRRYSCAVERPDTPGKKPPGKKPNGPQHQQSDSEFEQQTCLTESIQERLRHAAVAGKLPTLQEFELEDAAGRDRSQEQLPETVYQALSSLFAVLLTEEEEP